MPDPPKVGRYTPEIGWYPPRDALRAIWETFGFFDFFLSYIPSDRLFERFRRVSFNLTGQVLVSMGKGSRHAQRHTTDPALNFRKMDLAKFFSIFLEQTFFSKTMGQIIAKLLVYLRIGPRLSIYLLVDRNLAR